MKSKIVIEVWNMPEQEYLESLQFEFSPETCRALYKIIQTLLSGWEE